jgi:hypothetical protein
VNWLRWRRFDGRRVSFAWFVVLRAARADGVRFTLTSGKRTLREQMALFRQNMVRVGVPKPGHPLTAFPSPIAPHIRRGSPAHALDVNALDGGETRLQRWLESKGVSVSNPVPGEAWHMEVAVGQLVRLAVRELRAHRKAKAVAARKARALREARRKKATASSHRARYTGAIWEHAQRLNLPFALALALVEQESTFRNVWGGDPPPNGETVGLRGRPVSQERYRMYKRARDRGGKGKGGMQGVGPLQLTWWELQDRADKRGGAWKAEHNIAVGLEHLASLIRAHGEAEGIARYNGSGPAAARYSREVREKQAVWRRRLR